MQIFDPFWNNFMKMSHTVSRFCRSLPVFMNAKCIFCGPISPGCWNGMREMIPDRPAASTQSNRTCFKCNLFNHWANKQLAHLYFVAYTARSHDLTASSDIHGMSEKQKLSQQSNSNLELEGNQGNHTDSTRRQTNYRKKLLEGAEKLVLLLLRHGPESVGGNKIIIIIIMMRYRNLTASYMS